MENRNYENERPGKRQNGNIGFLCNIISGRFFSFFFLFRKLITSNLIRTPRRTHARTMNQVRVEETRRRSRRERLPFIKLKSDRPIHTSRESEEEKGNEIIPELG